MKRTGRKIRAVAADWLFYLLGSVIYAVAVDVFTVPNRLVPGGVTGLSALVHYLWPAFPVGAGILLINLPLLALALWKLGRPFTLRTAAVTVLSSVIIDTLQPLLPPYTGNPLLAALFGGVLTGAGLAMIYLRGATTGGSEIVARLMEKRWPHLSMGRLLLAVDGLIVALSAVILKEIEPAMYAVVLLFATSVVLDEVVDGVHRTRTVLIVTRRAADISRDILQVVERGVTHLPATGGYTGEPQTVLMCAVRPSEVYALQRLVEERDATAFIIVLNSERVVGNGFQPPLLPKQTEDRS